MDVRSGETRLVRHIRDFANAPEYGMAMLKNLGKGSTVRRMVRFPGPFSKSKKNKKKLKQQANGSTDQAPAGLPSAEQGPDFYSDLDEVFKVDSFVHVLVVAVAASASQISSGQQ